jgi:hypothetical protein
MSATPLLTAASDLSARTPAQQHRHLPSPLTFQKAVTMKDAKTLLLEFLAAVTHGQNAAALFAEDGAVELPFLHSLGIPWRHQGRHAISELQASLAELYLDFAFKPEDTHVLIDTPEQVFAEYMAHPTEGDRAHRPSPVYWPSRGRERPDQAAAGVSEHGRRGPGPPARRRQGPARPREGDLLSLPALPELRPSSTIKSLHRRQP